MAENSKVVKTQDMKILEGGKVMKVQKTRQRRILSCIYCHSKKVKCSRVQPVCNNCEKLGLECQYFVNERVSRGGKKQNKQKAQIDIVKTEEPSIDDINAGELVSTKLESDARNGSVSSYSDHNISPMSPKGQENSNESVTTNDDIVLCKDDSQFADIYFGLNIHPQSPMNQLTQPGNNGALPKASNASPLNLNNTLLQTPVMNSTSNNITNNFFNTNYMSQQQDDQYQFNLSLFPFSHETMVNRSGMTPPLSNLNSRNQSHANSHSNSQTNLNSLAKTNYQQNISNFIDKQNSHTPLVNANNNENNRASSAQLSIEINNSLNPYSSNPATTVNFLYGTNTYYENEHLIDDLVKHLPSSKERSFELISRYVNSVHILLPIMINLQDFIEEHTKFWEQRDRLKDQDLSSELGKGEDSMYSDIFQFYTLYFPILYASTVSEFEEYDNLLLNQDIDKYLKGFNKICQYYNYPHGLRTIPLLLGNVIIQLTSPNPSSMEMSQIIRYAKFLQMHKDPVLTLRINDWQVVKFRRLLWWVIFGLDALTSHNHCLPPICKFDDFNVLMPDEEEPVFDENGVIKGKKLNVTMLSVNVKFHYDRILSELVYQLHNGLSNNITRDEINEIKSMIISLFYHIHGSINRMTQFYKTNPPQTMQEMNLINFITNHSWSFVDRALMLLHKKILLRDTSKDSKHDFDSLKDRKLITKTENRREIVRPKTRGGVLSLSQYEDTFGQIQESNIINNFDNSTISQLKFSQFENFSYENLGNNLIPSILHNLNDFLKYNDFIKFGKYNWYVKRTIPLDSIILMFIIITVKFNYEFMTNNELVIYVKLINKALFILNRKWYKNEKYKRMLSLTNSVWRFILEKYNIVNLITQHNSNSDIKSEIEFCDFQVAGYLNMNELFNVMDVPQPIAPESDGNIHNVRQNHITEGDHANPDSTFLQNSLITKDQYNSNSRNVINDLEKTNGVSHSQLRESELMQLSEKIYYSLRNNFVDINDYCSFYISLENILHELMDYIHRS